MAASERIDFPTDDKLQVLRRLDQFRTWQSLDDKRQCIQCGKIFRGREIKLIGGTQDFEQLRLQCPTEECHSIPIDWIIPQDGKVAMPFAPADGDGASEKPPPAPRPKRKGIFRGKNLFRRRV